LEKKAVALGYNSKEIAPKILAKGRNKIADQIIQIAKEYGIPIKEDDHIIDALFELEIEDYIPEGLFTVVAELLAFIYKMRLN